MKPGGLSLVEVVGGGRVVLPAVFVALDDLVGALELFVVLVFDAERHADIVHVVLIGRWVVAPGRFVASAVGRLPVGVHVAAGERRAGLGVLLVALLQLLTARSRRRRGPIEVERGGRRRRHDLVVVPDDAP